MIELEFKIKKNDFSEICQLTYFLLTKDHREHFNEGSTYNETLNCSSHRHGQVNSTSLKIIKNMPVHKG